MLKLPPPETQRRSTSSLALSRLSAEARLWAYTRTLLSTNSPGRSALMKLVPRPAALEGSEVGRILQETPCPFLRGVVGVVASDHLFESFGQKARNRLLPFHGEVLHLPQQPLGESQGDVLDLPPCVVLVTSSRFHELECNTYLREESSRDLRLISIVDSVGEPGVGLAVDTVEGAVVELYVPVVAVGGLGGPPAVFERPGAGGDADGAGDGRLGAGGCCPEREEAEGGSCEL